MAAAESGAVRVAARTEVVKLVVAMGARLVAALVVARVVASMGAEA